MFAQLVPCCRPSKRMIYSIHYAFPGPTALSPGAQTTQNPMIYSIYYVPLAQMDTFAGVTGDQEITQFIEFIMCFLNPPRSRSRHKTSIIHSIYYWVLDQMGAVAGVATEPKTHNLFDSLFVSCAQSDPAAGTEMS